ncbi:Signal transduction histidine kinase [Sinosporangium album]|uniref:histidine kinase n=1 Tax=Sinosporangium album TaxID=504805 RepID=A0A1G7WS41_9ACTN|nr:histidine kinase [Sinosporangium album]SDG74714.1 Signal transduction histidine kinase [Sinosporangium album]
METSDRPTWASGVWRTAATAWAVLGAALLLTGADGALSRVVPSAVTALAVAATAWAAVRTRRQRRDYERRLTAWAADKAAHAERLRVARELHDIVSHGLGLITVRAAAARRVHGPDRERETGQALADIEGAAREATTELRRMLAVLRQPYGDRAPLRPADTLADLPAIVEHAARSGLRAVLDLRPVGEVSPGVQVTVCEVVREALANTARHAGPTDVRVEVRRDGETIVADVRDSGRAGSWHSQPGAGHGLRGLRERVTALGGTLEAGPAGGGFHLAARLPDGRHA